MIKIKIIPDKIFHILWDNTSKFENLDEYIRFFTSIRSKGYIDFYKVCGINEADILDTLTSIYYAGNMTIREIIDSKGYKKIDISHKFCIPIRTLEDWYSGKSKCNSYIRLMLIREFELLDLGKWVETEYKNIKKKTRGGKNRNLVSDDREYKPNNIYNDKTITSSDDLYTFNSTHNNEIYKDKDIKIKEYIYNDKYIKEKGDIYINKNIKDNEEIYNNKDIKENAEIYNNKDIKENVEIYNNKYINRNAEIYTDKYINESKEIYSNKDIKIREELLAYEEFLNRIEQSKSTARILEQTNYLDKIINKKSNNISNTKSNNISKDESNE